MRLSVCSVAITVLATMGHFDALGAIQANVCQDGVDVLQLSLRPERQSRNTFRQAVRENQQYTVSAYGGGAVQTLSTAMALQSQLDLDARMVVDSVVLDPPGYVTERVLGPFVDEVDARCIARYTFDVIAVWDAEIDAGLKALTVLVTRGDSAVHKTTKFTEELIPINEDLILRIYPDSSGDAFNVKFESRRDSIVHDNKSMANLLAEQTRMSSQMEREIYVINKQKDLENVRIIIRKVP